MVSIPILTYHQVGAQQIESPDKRGIFVSARQFAFQMQLLGRLGYRSIGLGELLERLEARAKPRTKAVVITFDDGYEGVARVALPIMQRYGFRGIVFLIGEDYVAQPVLSQRAYAVLDRVQVRNLLENGWEIGSHTMTHANLKELPASSREYEIAGSKRTLEERLGVLVHWFAYPYGSTNPVVAKVVEESRYLAAVTTEFGRIHTTRDRYALKRIAVGSAQGIPQFYYRLRWAPR